MHIESLVGIDVFFLLIGAILVFAMHAGFAFLEVGTVRYKNQVNALSKIITDFSISTVSYFLVGYLVAYGVHFFVAGETLVGEGGLFKAKGLDLVKFFFLATFAAAIPAIVSGGIAERAKFSTQLIATALLVGLVYPFFEGLVWHGNYGLQAALRDMFGAPFHDFAGSVVVHGVGGWIALAAILVLGPRLGRYTPEGKLLFMPPSNIPWLSLGAWLLCIGWFGFNVMSAQAVKDVSGLVALNSLMALVGGILVALVAGRNDPGFIHNGALAGLVAVCAGSDVMHPVGAFVAGGVAGGLFVVAFNACQKKWKVDDVLGVWALHGLCGLWGGIAAGIFGMKALGGLGGVALPSQIIGSVAGACYAFVLGLIVYGLLNMTLGIRLSKEQELRGSDLSLHKISATPTQG